MTGPSSASVLATASPGQTLVIGSWIDEWIELLPDGRFLVSSGKVEIGTGVATALAQIAAEELEVPVSAIEMARVRTGSTPDEGYTAGSRTIREGGAALRRVAAEARSRLVEAAAARLSANPDTLEVCDGVVTAPGGPSCRYADLHADSPLHHQVTGDAPLRDPSLYRVVGTSAVRPDIERKVVGLGGFVSDVRVPGMLHARVVRPPMLGSHLLDVDAGNLPEGVDLIRISDFLAVVADREEVAITAAERLVTSWSAGAQTPSMAEVYDWMTVQPTEDAVLRDDPEPDPAGLAGHSAEYRWPFQAHASVGATCAVADVRADAAVIYAAAQGVFPLRAGLAILIGLPEEAIEVVHHEGSGCYGHNGADDVAADAAMISQRIGRPVRVQWSRSDEMVWARKGPAMLVRLTALTDPAGNARHWRSEVWTPTHFGRARPTDRFIAGFLSQGVDEPDDLPYLGGDRNAVVDYALPQRVTMRWVRRQVLPGTSLRALGATATTFANESFVEQLAADARVDPLEWRRRHLEDPRALDVLDAVAEASDWGRGLPEGTGLGLACARYENVGAYLAAVARVAVDVNSGELDVQGFWIAHDCGLIVNPDGLRNQVVGNVIQSLSRTLLEEVRWDGPRITTRDWETYPILRFSGLPPVHVILLDRPDMLPVGAGEAATITTAPAVANAVAAATGARLRQAPFTPERVLAALAERGATS